LAYNIVLMFHVEQNNLLRNFFLEKQKWYGKLPSEDIYKIDGKGNQHSKPKRRGRQDNYGNKSLCLHSRN